MALAADLSFTISVLRERASQIERRDLEPFLRTAVTALRKNGLREPAAVEPTLLALVPDGYRRAVIIAEIVYGPAPPPKRKLAGAALSRKLAKAASEP